MGTNEQGYHLLWLDLPIFLENHFTATKCDNLQFKQSKRWIGLASLSTQSMRIAGMQVQYLVRWLIIKQDRETVLQFMLLRVGRIIKNGALPYFRQSLTWGVAAIYNRKHWHLVVCSTGISIWFRDILNRSIVSVDSSWGIGRRDGSAAQWDRSIFGLVSRHDIYRNSTRIWRKGPCFRKNYFYTSHCIRNESVLARLLAAVAELGVLEGTADKASSSSEGLFPWVKEGAALTYGLVYLHFH
ncbi:hypothetical protein ACJX0J_020615 [Zea mays]